MALEMKPEPEAFIIGLIAGAILVSVLLALIKELVK